MAKVIKANIEVALKVYYENPFEIGNAEIERIFGTVSRGTITRLKNQVKKIMAERGKRTFGTHSINTEIAYEIWGLNIKTIERCCKKLADLGIENNKG